METGQFIIAYITVSENDIQIKQSSPNIAIVLFST